MLWPGIRVAIATLALWALAFTTCLFSLAPQAGTGITGSATHTVIIANIAGEDVHEPLHELAKEKGYSYLLITSSHLSVGTIYDPNHRYNMPGEMRENLEHNQPLVKGGLNLGSQVKSILPAHVEPYTFQLPDDEADAYPDLILPPDSPVQPRYYELSISSDEPVDGQELARFLSPAASYLGAPEDRATPDGNWLIDSIYTGNLLIAVFVYLLVLYRNVQEQTEYLKTLQLLGGSTLSQLRRLMRVTGLPSLLTLIASAGATYAYLLTPYAGLMRHQPSYLVALGATSSLLPLICLSGAAGISLLQIRAVRRG